MSAPEDLQVPRRVVVGQWIRGIIRRATRIFYSGGHLIHGEDLVLFAHPDAVRVTEVQQTSEGPGLINIEVMSKSVLRITSIEKINKVK